jgi:ATP-dependent RNA helicase DDX47/RRP3
VELYQKIEALIGLKMEQYPAEQEAVLLLLERVGEAQRIATMQMKETDSKGKKGGSKRKGSGGDDEDHHHARSGGGGGYNKAPRR